MNNSKHLSNTDSYSQGDMLVNQIWTMEYLSIYHPQHEIINTNPQKNQDMKSYVILFD